MCIHLKTILLRNLVIIGLACISADATACSCEHVGIRQGRNGSDAVFVGRAIKINEVSTKERVTGTETEIDYKRYEFIFRVLKVYKGKGSTFLKDTVSMVTTGGGADCGISFTEGGSYLVYAYKTDKKLGARIWDQSTDPYLTTNVCTRTRKIGLLTFLERLVLRFT